MDPQEMIRPKNMRRMRMTSCVQAQIEQRCQEPAQRNHLVLFYGNAQLFLCISPYRLVAETFLIGETRPCLWIFLHSSHVVGQYDVIDVDHEVIASRRPVFFQAVIDLKECARML